jgi:hypothetical protein
LTEFPKIKLRAKDDMVEYTLPPIYLDGLSAMKERWKFVGQISAEGAHAVVDAIYLSLKPDYPELTREQVNFGINRFNYGDIIAALYAVNFADLDKPADGEGKATAA